jgi:acetyltransferase-like isoleucine patch superfamily enzyme
MRKITVAQIAAFVALQAIVVALTWATVFLGVDRLPLGDFRGVVLSIALVVFLYGWAVVVYRLFLAAWPLRPGDIVAGSGQESVYHVYILFYLILFYPVLRSGLLPTPAMRLFYLALGTRLGRNTYTQGILHDPPFIEIGADSVVGQSALLIPHVIEGDRLGHYPIRIGDRVTIGALSAILSDVTIGDDAIVATGAVVAKGSRIAAGEVWGGVPARRIGPARAAADVAAPV